MLNGLTVGMKAVLGIDLAIALLLALVAGTWDTSAQFGRPPSITDTLGTYAPVILVVAAALAATAAGRRGAIGLAWILVLAPIPVAAALAIVLGMVV